MKTLISILTVGLLATGCSIRNSVPRTSIAGSIAGQPFTIDAPKNTDLKGLEILAEADGSVIIKVESLITKMDPEVITTTGDAQVKMLQAAGELALKGVGTVAAAAAGKP
jgi:hypothetical protein